MPIRIEISLAKVGGLEVEIMRSWINDPMTKFLRFDFDTAVRIVRYLMHREARRVQANRYVSQSEKETKAALKQLHKEAERATRQKGR
jgi:hypothetical protein